MGRQRCAWHGLIVDDTGRCPRCRREATRQNARTIYAAVGSISVAIVLALVGWRLVASGVLATHARRPPPTVLPLTPAAAPESTTSEAAGAPDQGDRQARIAAASREVSIVLYTADYCGWCRKTKAWLDQRGLAYTERHVDTDKAAQREMRSKFRGGGIPALDIEGELRQGFDPAWLERTIRARAVARVGPG